MKNSTFKLFGNGGTYTSNDRVPATFNVGVYGDAAVNPAFPL